MSETLEQNEEIVELDTNFVEESLQPFPEAKITTGEYLDELASQSPWFNEPPRTDEEMAEEELRVIRSIRDRYLSECDWIVSRAYSQGTAVPEEWATYMQALRDLPDSYVYGEEIVWPTKPV